MSVSVDPPEVYPTQPFTITVAVTVKPLTAPYAAQSPLHVRGDGSGGLPGVEGVGPVAGDGSQRRPQIALDKAPTGFRRNPRRRELDARGLGKAVGKLVTAHRTHDDPLFQHVGKDLITIPYFHQNKIGKAGHKSQPHVSKLCLQKIAARVVVFLGAPLMLFVV